MASLASQESADAGWQAQLPQVRRWYRPQLERLYDGVDTREADLEQLERVIVEQQPALLYTIPNFQNPTGITTSQAHREALLALCERHRLPLVEDGFEEKTKYFGRVALHIKSMDQGKVLIYLGTFSKVLVPGLRVGWVLGDRELIQAMTAAVGGTARDVPPTLITRLPFDMAISIALRSRSRKACITCHSGSRLSKNPS